MTRRRAAAIMTIAVIPVPAWFLARNLTAESPDGSTLGYLFSFVLLAAVHLGCSALAIMLALRAERLVAGIAFVAAGVVVANMTASWVANRFDTARITWSRTSWWAG